MRAQPGSQTTGMARQMRTEGSLPKAVYRLGSWVRFRKADRTNSNKTSYLVKKFLRIGLHVIVERHQYILLAKTILPGLDVMSVASRFEHIAVTKRLLETPLNVALPQQLVS